MSMTITVSREFRLHPDDPTIIETRTTSTPWRIIAVCPDPDDAFYTVCCYRKRECDVVSVIEPNVEDAARALIDAIWPRSA